MTVVFFQPDGDLSLQAVTLAQSLGSAVRAIEPAGPYAPSAWAKALIDAAGDDHIVGPGSDRGNEVLAHVAAQLDLPFAANVTEVRDDEVTRIRWGGTLFEDARIHSQRKLLTAAPFAFVPTEPSSVEVVTPELGDAVRVVEHVAPDTGGKVTLADAKVVVSGGRGVGSAEGFAILEELAELLDAAVGCSRVVTSAGWRPHTDQVGQTGTKVSPDLYIACGISGATQHIAGCKGAKKLLAINADPEATIFAHADYAVIGDLHEIVPAITAELPEGALDIGAVALAALLVAAGVLFGRRAIFLTRVVRAGRPLDRTDDLPRRVRNEATIVLGQRKLFQRLVPGLMHALVFWGFLVLFPTILIALIGAVDKHATLPWLGHQGWYLALVDVFILAVLAGLATALWIRKVVRPLRFQGSHLGEADLILGMIALVVLTLLGWHAAQIAAGLNDWPAGASFLSNWVSGAISHPGTAERVFVWAHLCVVLSFLVYLPYSKHLHIATAAINVFFSRTRSRGRLEPLRFDLPEAELRFGAGTIRDLTWKEMVDAFSCTECGRCQDVCPAYATGKLLSPKLLIMGVRDQLFAEGPDLLAGGELQPIAGNGVPEEMIWDCVTCGACVHECPVSIEHVDHIVDLRRDLVMVQSSFPQEAESMLRDVERVGNPWGKPQGDRATWAESLGVRVVEEGEPAPEILYWVGCAAAYDERARTAAESTVKLLQKAGVDFAILGARESCTGDPARRMGNEYVFQAYAEQNVATLNDAGVTKIVASCPHCLNSLGNEYPDFGGRYEVIHHTQLLAELLRDGKLEPVRSETEITYHDSCYLARHNDVAAEPRELVAAVGTPVEMEKSGKRTFCCGAGGAHMWMEERGSAINEERVRQAVETGAETLAVACPFCTVMLDDGVRASGAELRVVDVATLLADSLQE